MSLSPPDRSGDPDADALALVRRVTLFSRELAGTLRRASVIDLLVRHAREALTPAELAVALYAREGEGTEYLHSWPTPGADRRALFELVGRRGALYVPERVDALLREAGLAPPADCAGAWLIVPLVAKGRVTGAVAARGPAGSYSEPHLALLEALAAQASVAFESARLVDLHDDGRRSWQEVVDAISPALCIVDHAGRIRRANRAFAELVDAPPATLIGRPWQAFVPPEWMTDLQRALDRQGAAPEVDLRTGDRHYCVSVVPIAGGDRANTVLLFDDQTNQRRLQDQLIQSEKMSAIGQLIAGIAHDLNNPLASVVGFADFLVEMRDVPANLREPLAVIQEEAERASSIVKNLLSFARKQDHQRRSTAVKPLLEATFTLLRNQLMATRVDARLEIDEDLPPLAVDAVQIQQVFVNLINNAAQAILSTGRPGTVLVRARRFLDGVAVDVIDDGPGMTEALAAQVFEPFFTTKPEGEGTGLGLSISQGIVREHGGRITLVTEEGRGSTFTVHLPVGSRPAPSEPSAVTFAAQPRLRVLVVDDEPHILHYMRATLDAWGHSVEVCEDGDDALRRATAESYDLVISDLRMPRLGGREFYEQLAQRDQAMADRIVFSTGDTVRDDTLAFLEGLGRPFLHKPFSLAELRELLARVATGRLPADSLPGA
jgi:two-component system NtrC family sensor kinase